MTANNLLVQTILPNRSSEGNQLHLVPLSQQSDSAIVALCQQELPQNKIDAYNEIVRRFKPLVFNRSLKMIGSRSDSEEICQDVFIQLFRKINQFEGRSNFKTWLFRIVFNMCMTRRGKLARRREKLEEFEEISDVIYSANADDAGIDDLCDTVHKALAKLEKGKREIIDQRFIKGFTLTEIAESQQLKLSATKMRLYRALAEFKEAYREIAA